MVKAESHRVFLMRPRIFRGQKVFNLNTLLIFVFVWFNDKQPTRSRLDPIFHGFFSRNNMLCMVCACYVQICICVAFTKESSESMHNYVMNHLFANLFFSQINEKRDPNLVSGIQ